MEIKNKIIPSSYLVRLSQFVEDKMKRGAVPVIIFSIIILVLIVLLIKSIFYSIMPGEAGVRWKRFFGGTQVDYVYPEGLKIIPPWDKMYIYNTRIQELSNEFDVLASNGLKVHINLSIRYAPKYNLLGLLHQKVGPDYANAVIIPEVESVLREVIGTMEAEAIYTTGKKVIIEALNKAVEQISERYIDVDDVLIRNIELPESVAKSICEKIVQKQKTEAYDFIVQREGKEAERKRIEAAGLRDSNKIIKESLSNDIMYWKSIEATLELSKSNNSKVIVVGSGEKGLPLFGNIPLDISKDVLKDVLKTDPIINSPETKELRNNIQKKD